VGMRTLAAAASMPGPAAVSAASEAIGQLQSASWWTASTSELLESALALEEVNRLVQAARLELLAEVETRGAAIEAGGRSTVDWLVRTGGLSRHEARRVTRLAGKIGTHAPAVRDALRAGEIDIPHAEVIATAIQELTQRAARMRAPLDRAEIAKAEQTLLELAPSLDPSSLRAAAAHLLDLVAPIPPEEKDLVEPVREFTCSKLPDGSGSVHGSLDAEGMALLEAALSPLSAPRPTAADGRDARTPARRRGDALVELARRSLADGGLPGEGGSPATVVVTLDHQSLVGNVGTGTLDDGTELAPGLARRLACDAMVIPAVLGTSSQVLDIGRASRTVPVGMRRALLVRDGGCAFPGCGLPPAWTDAHHIVPWSQGGETRLDNLVALCGHHHRLVHHSDWEVAMALDGMPTFRPPPGLADSVVMRDPTWRLDVDRRFGSDAA